MERVWEARLFLSFLHVVVIIRDPQVFRQLPVQYLVDDVSILI
jgi:hypothetical protein